MANLTISIDDDLLRRARIRALEQGTSVNALLRSYLESLVGDDARQAAVARIVARSRRARSRRGGKTWTRDELHER